MKGYKVKPRWGLCIGFTVFMAALVGCQRFEPRPIDPAVSARSLVDRDLTSPSLQAYLLSQRVIESDTWPVQQWSLDALTHAAYFFHPDLAIAKAGIQLANANQTLSKQRPNPLLTTRPAYNSTTPIPTPWILNGDFSFPIETAGKRRRRMDAAALRQQGATFRTAATAWLIRGQVRSAFVELWATHAAEAAMKDQYDALSEIFRLLEARYQAGDVSLLEVNQAKVEQERARVVHLVAKNQQRTARVQLAAAIGISVHALNGCAFDFTVFQSALQDVPVEELINAALTNRADVLASLAEYAAIEAGLHLEIARQYPNLNLNPGYNFDQSDNEWRLGLSLELPLLNRNQGGIAVAEARRQEQGARFSALQTRVLNEIELAVANYENARTMIEAAQSNQEAASRQERLANASYQAGETSLLAVATARSFKAMATVTSQEATANVQRAVSALELATQYPVTPESILQKVQLAPLSE
jgi:outer membrane protein, heavy metal efflux system